MAHGGGGGVDLWAYRRYMAGRYAPSTVGARWSVARDWLARHPDPGAAKYRDVEAWLSDRGLAASSTRELLVCLRAFYRWLLREELVLSDPTQLVDGPRVPRRLPRPASDREVAALARTSDVRLRALYALMALAGLRCVECSRLDWRDVDLAAGTVIVNGKGERERSIDLSPHAIQALTALRLASMSHGPVFVGPAGRRLTSRRVSQLVCDSMRAAGVNKTAHQLRHRCATTAYEQSDADLLAVRDLLGHASVATTEVYTAVAPGRTAKTSRALQFPAA